LEKKCTQDIIDGMEATFSFAISWRGMRARETKNYPFGREGTQVTIIKLSTIITLHALDGQTKLIEYMNIEIMKR
jgi:hypothetical protein